MTGRQILIACVIAIGVVSVPQRADGWPKWLGFLEELSGPGPFGGIRVSFVVLCVPEKREPSPFLAWGGSLECENVTPVPEVVVEYSHYESDRNNLFPEQPESDFAQVRIDSFEGSLVFPVKGSEIVYVGAGVGLQRFAGDAFGSFYRPSLNGNLRIYPLAGLENRRLRRFLVFSWVPTLIFPGYDWQDFGAPPGTFSENVDVLTGRLHVTFDFSSLVFGR